MNGTIALPIKCVTDTIREESYRVTYITSRRMCTYKPPVQSIVYVANITNLKQLVIDAHYVAIVSSKFSYIYVESHSLFIGGGHDACQSTISYIIFARNVHIVVFTHHHICNTEGFFSSNSCHGKESISRGVLNLEHTSTLGTVIWSCQLYTY